MVRNEKKTKHKHLKKAWNEFDQRVIKGKYYDQDYSQLKGEKAEAEVAKAIRAGMYRTFGGLFSAIILFIVMCYILYNIAI